MLGRVGAFLMLAALAVPYSPIPAVDDAEANGAFDALVRVFEYNGVSRQERPLVLTQAEAYDTYYFVMEAEEPIRLSGLDEGDATLGAAHVQVKRDGTGDVMCEGLVFHVSTNGHKHQICEGLAPNTHYVFYFVNTFDAEIQMWGRGPDI